MSDTIYNADGSVYMTFPPASLSRSDLEGWYVRLVSSGSHGPACGHGPEWSGTAALTTCDVLSFNGLLEDLNEFVKIYGYWAQSSWVVGSTFRWTWERTTPDGHRVSDMVIASKIP